MLADLLIYRIEGATLDGEHQVEALLVGEGQITAVFGRPLSTELQRGLAVLDFTAEVEDILRSIEHRRVVAVYPGVHQKGSSAGLVDPTEDRVRLGL